MPNFRANGNVDAPKTSVEKNLKTTVNRATTMVT